MVGYSDRQVIIKWFNFRITDYKELAIKIIAKRILKENNLIQRLNGSLLSYNSDYTSCDFLSIEEFRELIYNYLVEGIVNTEDINLIKQYIPVFIIRLNVPKHRFSYFTNPELVSKIKKTYKTIRSNIKQDEKEQTGRF